VSIRSGNPYRFGIPFRRCRRAYIYIYVVRTPTRPVCATVTQSVKKIIRRLPAVYIAVSRRDCAFRRLRVENIRENPRTPVDISSTREVKHHNKIF